MRKIGVIIQARMSSQRFYGKVLKEVKGKPLLQYILERVRRAKLVDEIVVATSLDREDVAIFDFCKSQRVTCHRGPLNDVAGRFKEVLDKYQFNDFVRVSGDSPLLDQRLIDEGIKIFRRGGFEIVTNVFKRTYPKGQSVEVLDSKTFVKSYEFMLKNPEDMEHVTPFFYRNHMNFKIFNFSLERDYSRVQLSVDNPGDINTVSSIIAKMDSNHWEYRLKNILDIHQNLQLLK